MKYEYKVIDNKNKAALFTAGQEGWLVVSESDYSWTLMRELPEEKENEV